MWVSESVSSLVLGCQNPYFILIWRCRNLNLAKIIFFFPTRVYRKKTFTELLTNYLSFTSYHYKVGLIKTLVDRAYKINNTWLGFHEDITKLMDILKNNIFPAHLRL